MQKLIKLLSVLFVLFLAYLIYFNDNNSAQAYGAITFDCICLFIVILGDKYFNTAKTKENE